MLPALRAYTVFLVGLMFFGTASVAHAVFETSLSTVQIEQVLEKHFPLSDYATSARVTLRSPQVTFAEGDIRLTVRVEARLAGGVVRRGRASIALGLSYKAALGGLYLSQPRVQQFELPGVEQDILTGLKGFVESMGRNALPLICIYTAQERELNHTLTKSALKSFAIQDDRLRLVFGFK